MYPYPGMPCRSAYRTDSPTSSSAASTLGPPLWMANVESPQDENQKRNPHLAGRLPMRGDGESFAWTQPFWPPTR
jgi:hypothetical protein